MRCTKKERAIKGRNSFTQSEIDRLRILIREKIAATRGAQKGIRAKIRRIGFWFSDFSDKKGYTVEDFDLLIRCGQIVILDKSGDDNFSKAYPATAHQRSLSKSNSSKRTKPQIVNNISELSSPEFGLDAIIDQNVKVLICGTFPSKESNRAGFYYQNQIKRFWGQALSAVGSFETIDNTNRESQLLKNNIGLWDIFECIERDGGNQDTAIVKAKYNAFERFLAEYPNIQYLVFNSKNAHDWFCEDHPEIVKRGEQDIIRLQSSSGSNGWFNGGEDWTLFFKSMGIENH